MADTPIHPGTVAPSHIAAELGVDPGRGLSTAEAVTRLARFGPNALRPQARTPAWRRFLAQFRDPLVYLLLAAVAVSALAWLAEGAAGVPVDVVVIVLIVVANAILGFVQENKAEDAVAALAAMTATQSTVLREGLLDRIPTSELVVGDVLVLDEGDAVGADARLFETANLRVQEASLTGESEAVDKDPATQLEDLPLGEQHNLVFKGTAVVSGLGRGIVTATGMNTELGRIATLLDETVAQPSPLQVEIAQISRTLGVVVIGIAVAVMATIFWLNPVRTLPEAVDVLLLGVSLAVAAVPEGLPAILSLVLAIGVRAMARRNAILKNLQSAETLGSVSVICTDKTGTLTRNEMALVEVVTASGHLELEANGYQPEGQLTWHGVTELVDPEATAVLVGGAVANNAQLAQVNGDWEIQGDPSEAAFLVAAAKVAGIGGMVAKQERVAQLAFTSERKLMSVLARDTDNGQARLFTKGAPEVLLGVCDFEQIGDAPAPLTPARRQELEQVLLGLAARGYRTLAVAWRDFDPDAELDGTCETGLVFAGIAALLDPPRPETRSAVAQARRAGIRPVMITGDHPVTALRIATDLGLVENQPEVLTGVELEVLTDNELRERSRSTTVYARVSPEHKLRIIAALQADHQIVAMTGDGVNDAPALKAADIGVAMGRTGTEVTKEAATMILGDDNFATIVAAVRRGRVIFDNIRKFLRYLLSSNLGEVATVFGAVTLAGVIGLSDPANPGVAVIPLLATQILWINLVTDSGPALAMGLDPETEDVMARPPRRYDDRIIDPAMWAQIIWVGAVMGVLSLVVFDLTLPGGLFGGMEHLAAPGQAFLTARTTVFTTLVILQLVNALNSRSDLASAGKGLFTNKWLWLSLAVALAAQVAVVEIPALQQAFGTVSLAWQHWALAFGCGLGLLLVAEVVKLIRRWAQK